MARRKGYGQFCPVAKGAEIFAERWTPLVVRELMCGSRRFNDLRRGVPLMSQSLLSQRLKDLEWAGIVERRKSVSGPGWEYLLTPSGEELGPVVEQLGVWAYRWFQTEVGTEDLDASLLMWDIRRNINFDQVPKERVVVHFRFPDAPQAMRTWWLVLSQGEADLCLHDPGYPVDMTLETDLRTMTEIWIGDQDFKKVLGAGKLHMDGPTDLTRQVPGWLKLSMFASQQRQTKKQELKRNAQ